MKIFKVKTEQIHLSWLIVALSIGVCQVSVRGQLAVKLLQILISKL